MNKGTDQPFFRVVQGDAGWWRVLRTQCITYTRRYVLNTLRIQCVTYPMRYVPNALRTQCVTYPMRYVPNALGTQCVTYPMCYVPNALHTQFITYPTMRYVPNALRTHCVTYSPLFLYIVCILSTITGFIFHMSCSLYCVISTHPHSWITNNGNMSNCLAIPIIGISKQFMPLVPRTFVFVAGESMASIYFALKYGGRSRKPCL